MSRILVVDDELNMRLVLETMLRRQGWTVTLAADGREAWKIVREGGIDTVITDIKMPQLDGISLLDLINRNYPSLPVVMITAFGSVSGAVDAVKKGAFDYLTKPFDLDELRSVIKKALTHKMLNEREFNLPEGELDRQGMVGASTPLAEIWRQVGRVAPTKTTVLILGETGTGKELVAKAIHANSPRRDQPFIKIHCGAIPANLMESELFGYEKGAFTGAHVRKPGKFELADGGTIFLDEIGEIPKDMQVKILRVLQEQEFERIGGLKTIKVDVRILAATNRNLATEVQKGAFREDLFYRLNVFPLSIPPLRQRGEDIALLAAYFLRRFNEKLNRDLKGINADVLETLAAHSWPGNIRELENLMERLVLVAGGEMIERKDLPEEFQVSSKPLAPAGGEGSSFKNFVRGQLEEVEKERLGQVLNEEGHNVTRAAKRLGISRKGLQLKMIKYGLRRED